MMNDESFCYEISLRLLRNIEILMRKLVFSAWVKGIVVGDFHQDIKKKIGILKCNGHFKFKLL